MKRLFVFLISVLCVLSFAACGVENGAIDQLPEQPNAVTPDTPDEPPAPIVFTRDNFPRLDGSTSTAPLGNAIASVLLGESRDEVADLISFSRTTQSFRALLWGEADLLIVAEPSPTVFDELAAQNVEIQMEPFATDALIFVVNEDNPVDSLTVEQIQKIYTGEITNWSEVGGEDLPIDAFQRNAESGSQVLMEKLVMGELTMMEPPQGYMLSEMGGLMDAVRGYDNSASAIGYSVYYYANDMRMAEGLKIIAVEGVAPEADSIRSGAYPFRNPYYVVKNAAEPADSMTSILYDWILSEEGQKLVDMEGYVSILDQSHGPNVTIHWDVWTTTDAAATKTIANRWYEEYTDDLIPSADYGQLIPYIGGETSNALWGNGYTLGLATMDGTIVTDAVFLTAGYSDYYDLADGSSGFLPVFLLSKVSELGDGTSRLSYGLAAGDGSWYTGLIYRNYITATPYGTLMTEIGGDVVMIAPDGDEVFRWDGDNYPFPQFSPDLEWYWDIAYLQGKYLLYVTDWSVWEPQYAYIELSTGNVTLEAPADLPAKYEWQENAGPFSGGEYQAIDDTLHIRLDSGGKYSFPLEGYHVYGIYEDKVMLGTNGSLDEVSYMVKDFSGSVLFGPYGGQWLSALSQYIPGPLMLCWNGYYSPGEVLDAQGNVVARPLGYHVYQYGLRLSFMDEHAYRITDLEGKDLLCIPRFAGDD